MTQGEKNLKEDAKRRDLKGIQCEGEKNLKEDNKRENGENEVEQKEEGKMHAVFC